MKCLINYPILFYNMRTEQDISNLFFYSRITPIDKICTEKLVKISLLTRKNSLIAMSPIMSTFSTSYYQYYAVLLIFDMIFVPPHWELCLCNLLLMAGRCCGSSTCYIYTVTHSVVYVRLHIFWQCLLCSHQWMGAKFSCRCRATFLASCVESWNPPPYEGLNWWQWIRNQM